jgi:hypothetical protein
MFRKNVEPSLNDDGMDTKSWRFPVIDNHQIY